MLVYDISDFDSFLQVLHTNDYVIVNISASWCKPCKVIKPEIIKFVSVIERDDVVFVKLDVDDIREDDRFDIIMNYKKIPYFAVFKNGILLSQIVDSNFIEVSKFIHMNINTNQLNFSNDF